MQDDEPFFVRPGYGPGPDNKPVLIDPDTFRPVEVDPPDEGGDEPVDDDEFEDFKPKPKPDLPWWAPFVPYLAPGLKYLPYLPITPLGPAVESNMNIDDLDLNFLLEAEAPPILPALQTATDADEEPYFWNPRDITTNNQGQGTQPPNGGEPPDWAWEGPGFPSWWDQDNDGVIDDPYIRRLYELYKDSPTGGFGRWIQKKNGDWVYEDFTRKFDGGAGSQPGLPGWSDYILDPRLLWDDLFR